MNTTRRHLVLAAGAVGLGLGPAAQALAQTPAWPNGPLRLVVPFPPGGLLDGVARLIAPPLTTALGQTVVVDNKSGSGGNLGADQVAKAAPDGNTWLLGSPGIAISPALYPKLPYRPDDLQPVALLGSQPNVLLVPADSPARSVADLLAMLRKAPGKYQYASNGNGTSLHLSAELLKSRTGTFVLHIPYRGSAPAMTALLAGEVQMMFDNLTPALPQIQGGRARALAVTSTTRAPALPDVPTLQEAGVADFDVTAWFGLMVPRATPPAIVQRLETESAKLVRDPALVAALRQRGITPGFRGASDFAAHLAREQAQWQAVVAYAKIQLD
jgi:tripartite-type tricarboxylate transporter receptor subunit TctC